MFKDLDRRSTSFWTYQILELIRAVRGFARPAWAQAEKRAEQRVPDLVALCWLLSTGTPKVDRFSAFSDERLMINRWQGPMIRSMANAKAFDESKTYLCSVSHSLLFYTLTGWRSSCFPPNLSPVFMTHKLWVARCSPESLFSVTILVAAVRVDVLLLRYEQEINSLHLASQLFLSQSHQHIPLVISQVFKSSELYLLNLLKIKKHPCLNCRH